MDYASQAFEDDPGFIVDQWNPNDTGYVTDGEIVGMRRLNHGPRPTLRRLTPRVVLHDLQIDHPVFGRLPNPSIDEIVIDLAKIVRYDVLSSFARFWL